MIENMKNLFRRASAGIRSEMCHPVKGYKVVLSDGWRNSKYEILNDEKHRVVVDGVEYQRIRALRRIERPFGLSPVEPGDLGGYVAMGYGGLATALIMRVIAGSRMVRLYPVRFRVIPR